MAAPPRLMARIGRERGWAPPTRAQFEAEADSGSIYVGSPETVARKIAATVKALGADRFDLQYSNGTLGARAADAQHRALRHQGRADGARDAGLISRRR